MDLNNILARLREERDALASAIHHLERLQYDRHHGRGRPPNFVTKEAAKAANHPFGALDPPDAEGG
jgi:hypothetical protein